MSLGKKIRIILILIWGMFSTKILCDSFYASSIEISFSIYAALIVGVSLFTWTLVADIRELKRTKTKLDFFPVSLFLLFMFLLFFLNLNHQRNESKPTLIQMSLAKPSLFEEMKFDFKNDGTFKETYGGFLDEIYSYGNYRLNDSIVFLQSNLIYGLAAFELLIRKSDSTTTVFQIDNDEQILKNEPTLKIDFDNRKNLTAK